MLVAEKDEERIFPGELDYELQDVNTCSDDVGADIRCPECGVLVTHVSKSDDGRTSHFSHCPRENNCTGSSVAESDEHRAMKNIALDFVEFALRTPDIRNAKIEAEVTAKVSEKDYRKADGLVLFEEHDRQLGQGLAIEAQWENKEKDKRLVTADYIESDISVLWIYENDFRTQPDDPEDWTFKLAREADIRDRVRNWMWPANKAKTDFRGYVHEGMAEEVAETAEIRGSDALLVGDVIDWISRKVWESKSWEFKLDRPAVGYYVRDVAWSSEEAGVAPRFEFLFRETSFDKLLSPPDTNGFIQEVRDSLETRTIPVTIPDYWLTFKKQRKISKKDKRRLSRGASLSVEVGPCPVCNYEWKAHPQADTAKCPNCATVGVGSQNDDVPVVDVNADRSEMVVDVHEYRSRTRSKDSDRQDGHSQSVGGSA